MEEYTLSVWWVLTNFMLGKQAVICLVASVQFSITDTVFTVSGVCNPTTHPQSHDREPLGTLTVV